MARFGADTTFRIFDVVIVKTDPTAALNAQSFIAAPVEPLRRGDPLKQMLAQAKQMMMVIKACCMLAASVLTTEDLRQGKRLRNACFCHCESESASAHRDGGASRFRAC